MRTLVVACLGWLIAAGGALGSTALESRVGELTRLSVPIVEGQPIAAGAPISAFYAYRSYRPAWTEREEAADLLAAIDASVDDGLDPSDFHAATVRRLLADWSSAEADPISRELLLTDALVRLLYQLYFGKVDPRHIEANWNFTPPPLPDDAIHRFSDALDAEGVAELIRRTRLDDPGYLAMRQALGHYRLIARSGGWQRLPPGPTLRPGDVDPVILLLRRRLMATGDREAPAAGPDDVFGPVLEAAVKRFQERHGLEADGLVGPQTRAALNVSVERRIDQLRVNLERARWVLRQRPDDLIEVDIAAFEATRIEHGRTTWQSRVIVGLPFRQTPVFSDTIEYIVFNPTWTVPRSILVKDVLPRIRRNPAYLAEQGFDVIDGQGRQVPLETATLAALEGKAFPWALVQRPGPLNALGRIKFMFPNPFAVYLHDTPQRGLFQRAARPFSSGCIRVDDALGLAEWLLAANPGWDRAAIRAAIASGETRTVFLARQMPVRLLYRTADVGSDGTLRFSADIYDRDGRLLAALDEPFRLRFPHDALLERMPPISERTALD